MSEETTVTEETIATTTDNSTDNGESQSETEGSKTFTQEQVNKLIAKEKSKVKSQFKDYDTIKQENEELKNKVKEVTTVAKTAEKRLLEKATNESLNNGLKEFNLPDETLVLELLDKRKAEYEVAEDGTVKNVKNLVQELITKHPSLAKKVVPDNNVAESNNGKETPKYSLLPNYGSNFFKGGGVKLVEIPTLINGN